MTDVRAEAEDQVYAEALALVVRRADPDWTAADAEALERWRAADPAHAEALARAARLWDRFDILRPAWEHAERRARVSRRTALIGIGLFGAGALSARVVTRPGFRADYRTAAGGHERFTLADGTEVELGTRTALRLGADSRHVTLEEGEGFFHVAPGAAPFVVSVLGDEVRAGAEGGTGFALRALSGDGLIATTRGAVELAVPGWNPIDLPAGYEARFSARAVEPARISAPGTVASWRRNRLVFADAPLSQVVAELGRYRRGVVGTDPRVGNMRVTAVFDTSDVAGAFASMERLLPVRVYDAGIAVLVAAG